MLFLALPISASTQMQNMAVISASDAERLFHGMTVDSRAIDKGHLVSLPDSLSSVLYASLSTDSRILLHIQQLMLSTCCSPQIKYTIIAVNQMLSINGTLCILLHHLAMHFSYPLNQDKDIMRKS